MLEQNPAIQQQFTTSSFDSVSYIRSGAGWQCSACTFINLNSDGVCVVCGEGKVKPPETQAENKQIPRRASIDIKSTFDDGETQEFFFDVHGNSKKLIYDLIGELNKRISQHNDRDLVPQTPTSKIKRVDNEITAIEQGSFNESFANAGVAGGERILKGFDNKISNRIANDLPGNIGLRQTPIQEITSLSERNNNIRLEAAALRDGGGARVNQPSHKRVYEISNNFERSVLIDPMRHLNTTRDRAGDESTVRSTKQHSTVSSLGVPLELAAVGSKIRNIHRVGGERVKEVDHFVESVETPVVEVRLKNGNTSLDSSEISAAVSKSVVLAALASSTRLHMSSQEGSTELLLGKSFAGSNIDNTAFITKYCEIFFGLLLNVFDVLGLHACAAGMDGMPIQLQMFYEATVRSNDFVCFLDCASGECKVLYVNALAFQQAQCCAFEEGREEGDRPTGIAHSKLEAVFVYWLTRVSIALQRGLGLEGSAASAQIKMCCLGMYNKQVRERMKAKISMMLEGQSLSSLNVPSVSKHGHPAVSSNVPSIVSKHAPPVSKHVSRTNTAIELGKIFSPMWSEEELSLVAHINAEDFNTSMDMVLSYESPETFRRANQS